MSPKKKRRFAEPYNSPLDDSSSENPSWEDALGRTSAEDEPVQVSEADVVKTLTTGTMVEQGLLPYSTNTSFLVTVSDENLTLPAVYKPRRGENPLWDFEHGSLCLRESAAYVMSSFLGWGLVPPTILRNGTRGVGSVQFFVDNDDESHYFTVQSNALYADSLRRLALFDYVINNADRKSGHCLIGRDRRLWAIDHGICFHSEYKLRTVIWEFSREPIEAELLEDLERACLALADESSALSQQMCRLLSLVERLAMIERVESLLRARVFPSPQSHRRNYPWPPI